MSRCSGGGGIWGWIVQRISALLLLVYTGMIGYFFISNAAFDYQVWYQFFDTIPMKLFSLFSLFLIVAHAWIGLWMVITDYIQIPIFQKIAKSLVLFVLSVYLLWSFKIFWVL